MTDRYNALIVTLEDDIREDDAEPIISAIKTLRGVQDVKGRVADIRDHIARGRARYEMTEKLWKVLHEEYYYSEVSL